jgi:copper(I)-binding protein
MRTITRRAVVAAVALIAASLVGACGASDGSTDHEVTVTKQWARTSAEGARVGAAYMNIETSLDDELIGASVDTAVAMDAQIHEMVMSGGNMTMQEVESIPVKAGETITFKPGGYHVMLIGLAQPLASGGTISVTLRFAKAGDVVVAVPIQEDAPA